MDGAEEAYARRVASQITQYANVENMNAFFPDVALYWKSKYIRTTMLQIFGIQNHYQFYAQPFMRAIEKTRCHDIASIGCGDGLMETAIAKIMRDSGTEFNFHLLELSPNQIERAERNVSAAGLTQYFHFHEVDINRWNPPIKFAAFMAHHSLHHIQNLEHVFDAIKSSLLGCFCTMDVIGRNGHMRWPEVLELMQLIWSVLPEEKRKHKILPGFEKEFVNWNCATEGFEGIRAQDILPCLTHRFGFDGFFAYGGLTDPFVSRGFGHHYDMRNPQDRALIDLICTLNDLLIDLGHIKPTQMLAVMTPEATQLPRIFRRRTPEFCIRWPDPPAAI
jgi:SAM-dependent methyltransferase